MASFSSGVQLGVGKVFIFVTNIRLYNAVQIDPCMRLFFPINIIIVHSLYYA